MSKVTTFSFRVPGDLNEDQINNIKKILSGSIVERGVRDKTLKKNMDEKGTPISYDFEERISLTEMLAKSISEGEKVYAVQETKT